MMDVLPSELLLQIFSELSYTDLKLRLPLVCPRFHSLLTRTSPGSSTPIDKILFRDAPSHTSPSQVILHPVFDTLVYEYTASISDVLVPSSTPLADTAAAAENATSPAVRAVVYHHPWIGVESTLDVKGSGTNGAVTVLDVMKGVAEICRRCKVSNLAMRDYEIKGFAWDGFKSVDVTDEKVVQVHDSGGCVAPSWTGYAVSDRS